MKKNLHPLNDVGRYIIGSSRSDRKSVEEVLDESGMPSVNKLIVKAIAMACWKAIRVTVTPNGPLNPLGSLLYSRDPSSSSNPRRTRAGRSGCLPLPAKTRINSFAWWAHLLWNEFPPPYALPPRWLPRPGPRMSLPRLLRDEGEKTIIVAARAGNSYRLTIG